MTRTAVMVALAVAVGIAVGVSGARALNAQQAPLRVTELLRTDVVGMAGQEVIVQVVEFGPEATSGKHYHPGHETFYVLEGSAILEREGQAPLAVKDGDTGYIPARQVHEGRNASKTGLLKILVFRIHEQGQPVTVRVP